MTDPRCGCCAGTGAFTPPPAGNRPGLDAIRYRVGTHGAFFAAMAARLTSHRLADGSRPLDRLTTRAPDDPAIALLDAWATVADVLTFYQERIANEGYLRTATERRSVLELARLVGYRLRPGVAASVFLAFTLEKGYRVDVPAGTRAQSVPGPGELPQFFETDEALPARTEWNAIPARPTRPSLLRLDGSFTGTRSLRLEGAVNNLRSGDAVLFVCGSKQVPYTVHSAGTDAAAAHTRVEYTPFGGLVAPPPPALLSAPAASAAGGARAAAPALARLASVVAALRKDASVPPPSRFQLARPAGQTYNAATDLAPQLLTHFDPRLKDTLYTAYASAPVAATGLECEVQALRVKAAPFGSGAPLELVLDDRNALVGRREWALAEFGSTARVRVTSTSPVLENVAVFRGSLGLASWMGRLRIEVTLADDGGIRFQEAFDEPDPPPRAGEQALTGTRSIDGGGTVQLTFSYDRTGRQHVEVSFRREGSATSIRLEPTVPEEGSPSRGLRVDADGVSLRSDLGTVTSRTTGRRTLTVSHDETGQDVTLRTPALATEEQLRTVSLDAVHDGIVAGSWAVVERVGAGPVVARVKRVRTVSRADYGISGRVTQLVLDRPWLGDADTSPALGPDATLALLRGVTIHARSEPLALAEEVIADDVAGGTIELDGLYDGLEAGRWLMARGVRTDIPGLDGEGKGVEATELVMLAGVEHAVRTVTGSDGAPQELPGDTLHTRLTLSHPLAYTYRRDGFFINANVVRATHGETKEEVLGSGDGRLPFQQFTLKQRPLTWRAAPTPSGVESTLEVRVNGVRWPGRETLLQLGANERGYTTRADDEGKATVVFGDGVRGARLPTGVENVTAVYRAGIGRGGNVDAAAISVLATRPLGVREVLNPQRASGGADPESRDQARRNVPVAVLALDRLVSVQDYADFARVFAGIGKASAAGLSDGRRRVVHLTVAGVDDVPIDTTSDLHRNLLLALARFGDPGVALLVEPREAVFLFVGAKVKVGADHLWENVEPRVRSALLDTLGFDRRDLGQDVRLSEVIGTIQAVEGVDYVDVDLLDGVSGTDAEDPETLAARLESLATWAPSTGTGGPSAGQPRRRVAVEPARVDPSIGDPDRRIRPAQIAYLNPELPHTLVLTEVTS